MDYEYTLREIIQEYKAYAGSDNEKTVILGFLSNLTGMSPDAILEATENLAEQGE